jgi:Arc/MetJ-type ribon-helix-helix transcriptional regulator
MPKPKPTTLLTISLPREMAKQVEPAMKTEQRTRSELVREALRTYLARPEEARLLARLAALPRVRPTPNELRQLRKGRQEMKAGNH